MVLPTERETKLTELVSVFNLVDTSDYDVGHPGSAIVRYLFNHVRYLDIDIPAGLLGRILSEAVEQFGGSSSERRNGLWGGRSVGLGVFGSELDKFVRVDWANGVGVRVVYSREAVESDMVHAL